MNGYETKHLMIITFILLSNTKHLRYSLTCSMCYLYLLYGSISTVDDGLTRPLRQRTTHAYFQSILILVCPIVRLRLRRYITHGTVTEWSREMSTWLHLSSHIVTESIRSLSNRKPVFFLLTVVISIPSKSYE